MQRTYLAMMDNINELYFKGNFLKKINIYFKFNVIISALGSC